MTTAAGSNLDEEHMVHLLWLDFCFSVYCGTIPQRLFFLLDFDIFTITSQVFVDYSSFGVCLIFPHDYTEVVHFLDRYNIELMLCVSWYACQEARDVCLSMIGDVNWLTSLRWCLPGLSIVKLLFPLIIINKYIMRRYFEAM